MAATDVVVPVEMGTYSLRGTADLLKVIQEVALTNPTIGSPRFLANRLENTRVSATIQEQLKRRYGDMVLCSTIRKASVVGASQINRRPIALEDPNSPASKDYEALVEELLNA